MNTKEAKARIEKQWGCKVHKENGLWVIPSRYYDVGQMEDVHDDRSLVKLAKVFSSEYTEPESRYVKSVAEKRTRAATRDLIKMDKFDEIPMNRPVKEHRGFF